MQAKRVLSAAGLAALVVVAGATTASAATPDVQTLTPETPASAGVSVVAPQDAAQQAPVNYSVSITSVPSKARAASQVFIAGKSTGFSNGNWVNAWITDQSGHQVSAGGNWVKAGKFTLPVSFQKAGNYTVQLSLGQYPEEQYSQIVPITVTKAAYDSKPVLTEDGNGGQRYLMVHGTANVEAGKNVYVYVTRPGTLTPRLAGTAVVQADGSYDFTNPTDQTLLNKNGHYVVVVSRANTLVGTVGVSTYYNTVYQGH